MNKYPHKISIHHPPPLRRPHLKDAGMGQHMKFHQCNPPYKQSEIKKNSLLLKTILTKSNIVKDRSIGEIRIQGTYLNTIKSIYSNLIINIKLNREKF